MKKTIKAFDKKKTEGTQEKADINEGAVPAYLLDRKDRTEGKALSQQVKQKRQDKAAKFNVPIPKVRMQSENEVFREVKSGKRGKSWKNPNLPNLDPYFSNGMALFLDLRPVPPSH